MAVTVRGVAVPVWLLLVLAYACYLLVVAWGGARFARARIPAMAMAATGAGLWAAWPAHADDSATSTLVVRIIVPGLVLLATYRLSGVYFVRPNRSLEHWLLQADRVVLEGTGVLGAYRSMPALVREVFELMYMLVYAVVPLGAAVLVVGGRADALEMYWAVVFAAELPCYAMLPWLQTRPPRALEAAATPDTPLLRRLNLAVLRVGSIQVNTFPSAHAAGSIAVALAVASALPAAGPAFLTLSAGITLATMLGRYHYVADSVIGVGVGFAAWRLLVA